MSESATGTVDTAADAAALAERVVTNLGAAIHASPETLRLPLLCLLSDGHVLVEDVPGVGKTVLAKAIARSLDLTFHRVQFTPDLLPADVTGVNVFDRQSGAFRFRPGPVFANVLLVDEINRASPKTQSSLLEAMQETQVTVDGATHVLERPFLVVATQNPVEYEGTYPLPEAQLDRFASADDDRVSAARRRGAHAGRADDRAPAGHTPPRRRESRVRRCDRGRETRPRRGERHPLRRRAPPSHALERAARARRQPALGDRAPRARQGARSRRAPRLRAPGGRPGARGHRPRASPDPRARGARDGGRRRRRSSRRRSRARRCRCDAPRRRPAGGRRRRRCLARRLHRARGPRRRSLPRGLPRTRLGLARVARALRRATAAHGRSDRGRVAAPRGRRARATVPRLAARVARARRRARHARRLGAPRRARPRRRRRRAARTIRPRPRPTRRGRSARVCVVSSWPSTRRRPCSCARGFPSSARSSRTPARGTTAAGAHTSAVRAGSSRTGSATTSRASRCAPCTGPPRRGGAS